MWGAFVMKGNFQRDFWKNNKNLLMRIPIKLEKSVVREFRPRDMPVLYPNMRLKNT